MILTILFYTTVFLSFGTQALPGNSGSRGQRPVPGPPTCQSNRASANRCVPPALIVRGHTDPVTVPQWILHFNEIISRGPANNPRSRTGSPSGSNQLTFRIGDRTQAPDLQWALGTIFLRFTWIYDWSDPNHISIEVANFFGGPLQTGMRNAIAMHERHHQVSINQVIVTWSLSRFGEVNHRYGVSIRPTAFAPCNPGDLTRQRNTQFTYTYHNTGDDGTEAYEQYSNSRPYFPAWDIFDAHQNEHARITIYYSVQIIYR